MNNLKLKITTQQPTRYWMAGPPTLGEVNENMPLPPVEQHTYSRTAFELDYTFDHERDVEVIASLVVEVREGTILEQSEVYLRAAEQAQLIINKLDRDYDRREEAVRRSEALDRLYGLRDEGHEADSRSVRSYLGYLGGKAAEWKAIALRMVLALRVDDKEMLYDAAARATKKACQENEQ